MPGMVLELADQDRELLVALVKRYQKQFGVAFKCTRVFVIRQLLRHASAMRKLPEVRPDGETLRKDNQRPKGMVVELETQDIARLVALVERYEESASSEGYRSSKAFVIRQLLRYAADLKEMPPLRG